MQTGGTFRSMAAMKPWLGPVGGATWNLSLSCLEWLTLGRHSWWRNMRQGLRREFADLVPNQMVVRLRGKDPGALAYGESPPLTVLRVLERLQLPDGSRFVDLGAGRGVPCFTAANNGFTCVGLEFFHPYTERCQRIARRYSWPVEFLSGNFLSHPLPAAELYWVSSSAFPEELREKLQLHLLRAPAGSWVVTQDWVLDPPFRLELSQQLPVSWGVAQFCYHQVGLAGEPQLSAS